MEPDDKTRERKGYNPSVLQSESAKISEKI